jgi:hypothetical protein
MPLIDEGKKAPAFSWSRERKTPVRLLVTNEREPTR